jgi:hypothetical protein
MEKTKTKPRPGVAVLCITGELKSLQQAMAEFKALDDEAFRAIVSGEKITEAQRRARHDARILVMHHAQTISRFVTPEVLKLMEDRAND